MKRACSIADCGMAHQAVGWCIDHYGRWRRHGDPLSGGTAKGEAQRYLNEVVLAYEGNDCHIWPYGRAGNGYAQVGRHESVCRLVCAAVHGPAPSPDHEAAHGCGQGDHGCVTKRHLSWKTKIENEADKRLHGTHMRGERSPASKLTESEAREILALKGKSLPRVIGERFAVSDAAVRAIHSRRNWAWLDAA